MIAPFDNRLLDKYEIIHEIKRGGFGIVYYGLDKRLNKPIAIKKIVPNLAGEENFLDMFHDEALNVARLNHNNIVHIYDLKKTVEGHLYIIMEYIDGYDLERIIRLCRKFQLKFPPELAAHVAAETCVALDYANQRRDVLSNKPLNLVHQDVSPSNIMVSRMGSVKLIDFGISSVKLHQKTEKKSNKLRGKIPYMAPEQMIRGNVPDHRSDIFSLGLVLYETLAGSRIFNTRDDVYGAGKNPKAFRKACDVSNFPKKLGQIVTRSLDIDITKRYQRASEMHAELIDYLNSRNGMGEFNDALAIFVSEELDKRRRKPVSTPATPGDAATNIGDTTAKSSSHYTATSKWQELEIIDDPPKNQQQPESNINTPVNTKRITRETLFTTTEPASQESDYIKNIIDVIAETAKENKQKIIQFFGGLLVLTIILGSVDIFTGWSQAGAWVRDILFQQTLTIETIPPDAQVYLNGRQIQGLSPMSLADIPSGNHKMELRLKGYKPLIRTISVQPDGKIAIKGHSEQDGRRFVFRFETEIHIDSNPQGASVIVNGTPIDQRTPCTLSWKVGRPFSLELVHAGFQKLSGFTLDTVTNSAQVEYPEFWHFKILKEKEYKYTINATFTKKVVFNTTPRDVQIYDLVSNEKLNDGSDQILLSAGLHNIELRKAGLLPKRLQLNITKDTESELTVVLERNVLFTARDGANDADIGADLISLKSGNREFLRTSYKTPVELKLPAYSYTAIFSKPGYGRRQVTFGPDDRRVSVVLSAANAIIELEILDALSGQPIEEAEILYHVGENPTNSWNLLEKSDSNGKATGELQAGKYVIAVKRTGFRSMSRSITAQPGETQFIRFKIYPSS